MTTAEFVEVCPLDRLQPERGVAALLDGRQVAVFRTFDDALHAVDNRDPFTGQNVLSRGIVGTNGDAPVVASPLLKQCFDLRTGMCVTDDTKRVTVHDVRVRDGMVEVRLQAHA
ncbi:nitrite reductase small subunit NirD [uncultured Jatrophihabitans sp.]|uniref:nitrite reductase small subunit NirD n=1 Tax=uncultured Jatrophihabitans sp. TaxID=1610747 RepID=UPI0035CC16FD